MNRKREDAADDERSVGGKERRNEETKPEAEGESRVRETGVRAFVAQWEVGSTTAKCRTHKHMGAGVTRRDA